MTMTMGSKLRALLYGTLLGMLLVIMFFLIWATESKADDFMVVQPGDCLSSIAGKYLGNEMKWKELWALNPQIVDPNLIYPGQKILVVKTSPRPLTGEELTERIARFMYKIRGLPYADPIEIAMRTFKLIDEVEKIWAVKPYVARNHCKILQGELIEQEMHEYAWTIAHSCKPLLLLAIAWQETHFLNCKGMRGEVSFFHLLPSTIRFFQYSVDEVRDNPTIATEVACSFLKDINYDLKRWNTHPEYARDIERKLIIVQKEIYKP